MENNQFSKASIAEIINSAIGFNDNVLFSNANEFSYFIENNAKEHEKTCTATILEYCDNRDIEPDAIAKLISTSLKGKLQMEMIESGLLPEHNTLFE
jgi:hypothetical protein